MRVADYIKAGYAIHKDYGKVAITGALSGAKAMINVRVIQRGRGWNYITQQYERYFVGSFWSPSGRTLKWGYTNKDQYGATDTVHIKTLKPDTDEQS